MTVCQVDTVPIEGWFINFHQNRKNSFWDSIFTLQALTMIKNVIFLSESQFISQILAIYQNSLQNQAFTWTILFLSRLSSKTRLLTEKSSGRVRFSIACRTLSIAITVPVRPTPAEQCSRIGSSGLNSKVYTKNLAQIWFLRCYEI